MKPWETKAQEPGARNKVVAVPMPVADWLALSKAWDTYEYCCIMEALILGTQVTIWRAN